MGRINILFLHEQPTGLDPQTRANLWTYLEKVNKGKTNYILDGSLSGRS